MKALSSILLVCLAAGCSSSQAGPGSHDPYGDVGSFCEQWGKAACNKTVVTNCSAASADKCVATQKEYCLALVSPSGYSSKFAKQCIQAVHDAYADAKLTASEYQVVTSLGRALRPAGKGTRGRRRQLHRRQRLQYARRAALRHPSGRQQRRLLRTQGPGRRVPVRPTRADLCHRLLLRRFELPGPEGRQQGVFGHRAVRRDRAVRFGHLPGEGPEERLLRGWTPTVRATSAPVAAGSAQGRLRRQHHPRPHRAALHAPALSR